MAIVKLNKTQKRKIFQNFYDFLENNKISSRTIYDDNLDIAKIIINITGTDKIEIVDITIKGICIVFVTADNKNCTYDTFCELLSRQENTGIF